MLRFVLLLLLFFMSSGQYTLDRGIYLSSSLSGTMNTLFESLNFESDNPSDNSFKGAGFQYDIGLVYALNRRSFFEVSFGSVSTEFRHNSVLFDSKVVDKNITSTYDFNEFTTLYSYVFDNSRVLFGGGTKIYFARDSKADFDPSVNGEMHVGFNYRFKSMLFTPVASYSFPISNLKTTKNDYLRIGIFQLGLKIWFKLL